MLSSEIERTDGWKEGRKEGRKERKDVRRKGLIRLDPIELASIMTSKRRKGH